MFSESNREAELTSSGACSTQNDPVLDSVTRREFVKRTVVTGVAVGVGVDSWAAETKRGEMIYRMLGRTGERVSAIGLGGYHIGSPEEQEGIKSSAPRSTAGSRSWTTAGTTTMAAVRFAWAKHCAMVIAKRFS